MLKNIIVANSYFDSATLMLLTNKVKEQLGLSSQEVAIMMATEMNKRIMRESNLLDSTGEAASSGDMLIALQSDLATDQILEIVNEILAAKTKRPNTTTHVEVTSVQQAIAAYPESNFAVVSLPGVYAAREVKKLLNADKHVLLFSDNVSLEDEIALKDLAIARDLLMMGPDCGTAIVNGVGLGFSNKVNRGNIGIVAASGTGLQEVATIISNLGFGISQAFGTGGRDIKDVVGGRMMLYCLDLLLKDPLTEKIVIVSKPPEPKVLDKIKSKLVGATKPIIACFLGASKEIFASTNIHFASTLSEAAYLAVGRQMPPLETSQITQVDGNLRAIYCGGTLAYEALLMLEKAGVNIHSNLAKTPEYLMNAKTKSQGHVVLDMGEDEFTVGKPHPMIDPSSRSERIRMEAHDPSVRIILADVELGYGSNDLATSELAKDFAYVKSVNPEIVCLGVLCGSELDYQGYSTQRQLLVDVGVIVANSNAHAINIVRKLLGA